MQKIEEQIEDLEVETIDERISSDIDYFKVGISSKSKMKDNFLDSNC